MKVRINATPGAFEYRLDPAPEDPTTGQRVFGHLSSRGIALVNDTYRVELPPVFRGLHPDLHAAAIWYAIRPFIGRRLELPFGVSADFAARMERVEGVTLPHVDGALARRTVPSSPRPCLLFSGGVDSLAASQILPEDTVHLFLDRIPHFESAPQDADSLTDLVEQRAVCERLRAHGRELHIIRDDHEHLHRPYPSWHSEMSLLPALYLADTLGLHALESGDVLDVMCFQGYHAGTPSEWRFRPYEDDRPSDDAIAALSPEERARLALEEEAHAPRRAGDIRTHLGVLGLAKVGSTFGLSEVATAFVVARGPHRGHAWSCYYHSDASHCGRCDKCFKKVLLDYIADDREVPAEVFGRFLAHPHLAGIFARPYADWHHIWYFVFQKMRCAHPFAAALRAQAQRGPDLALLARWYPGGLRFIPSTYRDTVLANLDRYIGRMSDADVAVLEGLDVPPLHAPAWAPARAAPPVPAELVPDRAAPEAPRDNGKREAPAADPDASFQTRTTTLTVTLRDRLGRYPDFAFYVGAAREEDQVFRRVGAIGLAHAPCRPGKVFEMCAATLVAAIRAAGAAPESARLAEAIRAVVARTPLPRRFDLDVRAAPDAPGP